MLVEVQATQACALREAIEVTACRKDSRVGDVVFFQAPDPRALDTSDATLVVYLLAAFRQTQPASQAKRWPMVRQLFLSQ